MTPYAAGPEDGPALADWAEALMLVEELSSISRDELRDRLNSDAGDPDVSVDLLMGEVEDRSKVAPATYPFRDDAGLLTLLEDIDRAIYEMFLWAALPDTSFRVREAWGEIEPFFDEVVMEAVRSYLGSRGAAVRFGWPPSGERPSIFPEALDWLSELIGIERGTEPGHANNKDGGVDSVVWHPFADGRPGFLTFLIQSTVRTKWHGKVGELHPNKWGAFIDFPMQPSTAVAIPYALASDHPMLSEVRREVTIIFDRLRLCQFSEAIDPTLREAAKKWADGEREAFLSDSHLQKLKRKKKTKAMKKTAKKKTTTAKKTPAKKTPAKKTPAKKTTRRKR